MIVQELFEQARMLSAPERKHLAILLIDTLDLPPDTTPRKTHSILQLAGLGKEVWAGIDAQAYMDQLRSEWDHRNGDR